MLNPSGSLRDYFDLEFKEFSKSGRSNLCVCVGVRERSGLALACARKLLGGELISSS